MHLATQRPRSVAEIVDVTFAFYRANFATVVTVALLVVVPTALLKLVAPAGLVGVIDAAGNLLLPIGEGAIAAVVAGALERAATPTVGDAFGPAVARVGSLIAVQIAAGLMMAIGFLLLVVPGFIAIIWTAVSIPVVVIEQVGYSAAIDRSRALASGRWGHVLGALVLSWVIAVVLFAGASFGVGMLGLPDRVESAVVDLLLGVVLPIPAIAMAFLYYDLRIRSEGADLDAMISTLPTSAPVP